MTGPETAPLLRVVKGDPSDEELAALVAVIAAVGARQDAEEKRPRRAWSAPHRLVRRTPAPTWRSSTLPH